MQNEIIASIRRALDEDIGAGDVTTNSIVPADATMQGQVVAKQDGVVAGLDVARAVFNLLDDSIQFNALVVEGQRVARNLKLISLEGRARPLLDSDLYSSNAR